MEAVRASRKRWMEEVRERTGRLQTSEDVKKWFHHKGWFEPTLATMRLRGKLVLETNETSIGYAKHILKDDKSVRILEDFHKYIVDELEKLGVVVYPPSLNLNGE